MDGRRLIDEVDRARTLPPRVKRGTRTEPVHVRFGSKVHYGRGKGRTHIGVKTRGAPAHLYRKRMYVGTAQKGWGRRLTAEERTRVNALMDELEQLPQVRDARHRPTPIYRRLARMRARKGKDSGRTKLAWGPRYYHGTAAENVDPILKEGLKPARSGVTFLSKSPTVARFFGASKEINPGDIDVASPVRSARKIVGRLARGMVHQDPLLVTPSGLPLRPDPMLPRVARTTTEHVPPSMIGRTRPSAVTRMLRRFVKVGYKLQGHTDFQGLKIAIENRKGSVRKGKDSDGKPWRTKMKMPYGYIVRTRGADDEPVDAYVGPKKDAKNAYVVHQKDKDKGTYDEDKVFLGLPSKKAAKEAFLAHYDSPKFLGPISIVDMDRLRELVRAKRRLVKISAMLDELEKTARVPTLVKQWRRSREILRGGHDYHTARPEHLGEILASGKLQPGKAQLYGGRPGVYFGKGAPAATHPVDSKGPAIVMPRKKTEKHLIRDVKSDNPRDKVYRKTREVALGKGDYLVAPTAPKQYGSPFLGGSVYGGLSDEAVQKAVRGKRLRQINSEVFSDAVAGGAPPTRRELKNLVEWGRRRMGKNAVLDWPAALGPLGTPPSMAAFQQLPEPRKMKLLRRARRQAARAAKDIPLGDIM